MFTKIMILSSFLGAVVLPSLATAEDGSYSEAQKNICITSSVRVERAKKLYDDNLKLTIIEQYNAWPKVAENILAVFNRTKLEKVPTEPAHIPVFLGDTILNAEVAMKQSCRDYKDAMDFGKSLFKAFFEP